MEQIRHASQTAVYKGNIRHRRFIPVSHEFNYRLSMLLLDLDTADSDLGPWPIAGTMPCLGWFRRNDYVGKPGESIKDSVLNEVEIRTGSRPGGKILLLTHLRYWGFMMNPLAVFYCYENSGTLAAIVLQVTNTPWREKVLYVLEAQGENRNQQSRFVKRMHVSPFNPMDMTYFCRYREPDNNLFFHLENHSSGCRHTDATMTFKRSSYDRNSLLQLVFGFPAMTIKVGLGIYWQAFRLWLKKSPLYNHPKTKRDEISSEITSTRHSHEN